MEIQEQKIKLASTENREQLFKSSAFSSVVKIESALLKGARDYLYEAGYTEVITPSITKATGSCENINTLFEVNYFGSKAYLVQTGQLYLESLIPALGKVFCIGGSMRAEPEVDSRHLTEFTLVEIELPTDFEGLLTEIERLIHAMVSKVRKTCGYELDVLGVKKPRFEVPVKKITYTRAIEILSGKFGVEWGSDIKSAYEYYLLERFKQPFFLTHFPEKIKFFNMRTNPENPSVVNSADLILPGAGETVGAAEREYTYESTLKKLKQSQMLKNLEQLGGGIKDFEWYLNHLKAGTLPHAGCGIGLNRLTKYIVGAKDIRATTAFPLNRVALY